MKALTIRGPFKGPSGYDHHVREFVRELHNQGVSLRLKNFFWWYPVRLPKDKRDPWFETLKEPVNSRAIIHFCMPHQVRPARKMLNVNFTMFEATRIPKKWVEHNRRHDLVLLPTESSKRAWIESGVPEERIKLCPLGVNPNVFHPEVRPMRCVDHSGRNICEYKVRFLNVSDVIPRKNLLGLLRVWILTTNRGDDALLILKLSCGSRKWLKRFMRSIEDLEAHLGKTRRDSAPVVFIHRYYADADMPKLFAAATHYWSMSYGEGWDQSMMEACAMGLHVIAPKHTAYTTYLDRSIARLVPVRRVPAVFKWSTGLHKLFQGADWWEPDEDAAAESLLQAIAEAREGRNVRARERMVTEFTWEKATQRLIEILEELNAFDHEARRNRGYRDE